MTSLTRWFVPTLAVLAAACVTSDGSDSATAAELAAADVVIVAHDTVFVDPPSELPAGEITVGLDNQGRAPHDLAFEGEHGVVVEARGGDAAVADVTLEPGSYTAYCSVSGHRSAGMEFEVDVR